jgi:hypothetical protein
MGLVDVDALPNRTTATRKQALSVKPWGVAKVPDGEIRFDVVLAPREFDQTDCIDLRQIQITAHSAQFEFFQSTAAMAAIQSLSE